MTDTITAAAAFLILATQPAQVPRPVTPIMPVCCVPGWEPDCQLTMDMSPPPVQGTHHVTPAPHPNHLTVRVVPTRQYYDHHRRRHRHHRGWRFDDQP